MKIEYTRSVAFAPTPCVLVCAGDYDSANIITVAWAGIVCSAPLLIGVSIRKETHSYGLIVSHNEFTVNIPDEGMMRETDTCGVVSGVTDDKFALTGFTKVLSKKVRAPIINEAIINIECALRQTIELGSHTLFLGEAVQVFVDDRIIDEHGKASLDGLKPVAYCPITHEYRAVGGSLGKFGFSRRKS